MRIPRESVDSTPEINLIPLIDILLVIVIFLVVNTTFIRQSQLNVELPGSQTQQKEETEFEPLIITVGRDGNYGFRDDLFTDEQALNNALTLALASLETQLPEARRAIIEADATATHQSVVTVMDILASLGVARVSIATAGQ